MQILAFIFLALSISLIVLSISQSNTRFFIDQKNKLNYISTDIINPVSSVEHLTNETEITAESTLPAHPHTLMRVCFWHTPLLNVLLLSLLTSLAHSGGHGASEGTRALCISSEMIWMFLSKTWLPFLLSHFLIFGVKITSLHARTQQDVFCSLEFVSFPHIL